ncbi:MAG TPA: response regulator [Polyangiaceae bacterium]|nr:response regulator [Polyangiaceae bacterium]
MPKILLVEDNELNSDMLTRRLQKRGYEVHLATDGEQAVAMTKSLQPHLVLMDISLPLIDGCEATRRIKADPATQSIPIIALTAHALPTEKSRALEAGCDDYDTKPVELQRLLGKITAVIGTG